MKPEELELVKAVFVQVLDERRSINEETHKKDHDFLHVMMQREKRREDLVENTKKQVLGWSMIAVIGFIGYSLLEHIKNLLVKVL